MKKNTSTEIEVIRNACTANVDGETFGEATGASTQAGAPRLARGISRSTMQRNSEALQKSQVDLGSGPGFLPMMRA